MATAADEDPLRAHLRSIPEYSTAKVNFYYSSLPSRKDSNPTGYSSALAWWRRSLVDLTARGLLSDDKLVLHVDEQLREKLRWDKAGRPTSLGVIVAELAQSSDLVPTATYLASPAPDSFSVVSLLARPFWWSLSKVWGSSGVDLGEHADENEWKKRQGEYVVPDLVEKAAAALLPRLDDLHGTALSRLYTLRTFQSKLGALCLPGVTLSERDCRVLATYLSRRGHCAFDGEVIKFAAPHSTAPTSSPLSVTESDRSTLTLFNSLASLTASIDTLTTLIASERARAAQLLGEKKPTALVKAALGAKKRAEKLLDERVAQRAKVEEVVWAIERAKGDEETLSALSLGATTLCTVLSSPTLQLSDVEATTSLLDDSLVAAQEVREAVDAVGAGAAEIDEDDVERELREMVAKEEKHAEELREREITATLEGAGKVPVEASVGKIADGSGEREENGTKEREKVLA
ncbi:uncharacterized protein JCM10292_001222 [Rhodotorula paludigena]|uniref:uncharacterized protein n=1 Tax=Rhodotorula paludigena TaxID=86838 RepID=UPI0031790CCF